MSQVNYYHGLLCVVGKLGDGPLVVLHLWLVMMRQPRKDGTNGTIKMHGYGLFLPVDVIVVGKWGMVRTCHFANHPLRPPTPGCYREYVCASHAKLLQMKSLLKAVAKCCMHGRSYPGKRLSMSTKKHVHLMRPAVGDAVGS